MTGNIISGLLFTILMEEADEYLRDLVATLSMVTVILRNVASTLLRETLFAVEATAAYVTEAGRR